MQIFHKNFIAKELIKWQNDGLIDQQTAQKIATRYGLDFNELDKESSSVLRIVAYFFFGCALLTLVGANWEEIPRDMRAFLLIGLTAFVNFAGFSNLQKGENGYGEALLLLGSLVFGASGALIAQIYNLDKTFSNGVFLWAIGTLGVALIAWRALLVALALLSATIWLFVSINDNGLSEHLYLLFLVPAILMASKQSSRLLISLLFIGNFAYISVIAQQTNVYEILHFYFAPFALLAYFVCCYGMRYIIIKFKQDQNAMYLSTLSLYAIAMFMVVTFSIFTFDEIYYQISLKEVTLALASNFGAIFAIFIAISIALAVNFKDKILLALTLFVALLPFVLCYVNALLISSVVLLALAIWLIKNDEIFKGVGLIFYIALVLYMRLVGDYIGTSVLFLCFAVSILLISKFRRKSEKI